VCQVTLLVRANQSINKSIKAHEIYGELHTEENTVGATRFSIYNKESIKDCKQNS